LHPLQLYLLLIQVSRFHTDTLGLIKSTGVFAKLILLILLFFSIVSWMIIIDKYTLFRLSRRQSSQFLHVFRQSSRFSEVKAASEKLRKSPLTGLFLAGFNEINYQLQAFAASRASHGSGESRAERPIVHNLEAVSRALLRASSVEVNKLERALNFLASTASACPFIGLAGTVVGIMHCFGDVGLRGAGIASVAQGISEALVTTAAGLIAAIPAAIAYNYFVNKIKTSASEMDDFALEFISITERNFGEM
jgi:biopolymer transport protein TolQ